ncbi:MAG: hypothetical protein HN456_10065, partial [Rhodobacteraceae bacterium]|nr:hypothetical protein [Paracoccaceae bacterium]
AQAWDKAIEAAQRLAAKRPEDPVPYNLIGSALMGKGETELAEWIEPNDIAALLDIFN